MIKLKNILTESEYWGTEKQPFWYKGPNPTVDLVILKGNEILLIKRGSDAPAAADKWALPGGFQDTNASMGEEWREDKEKAIDAAVREVKEETGLDVSNDKDRVKKIGTYEGKSRDGRDNEEAWSRTNAFFLELPLDYDIKRVRGLDDAQDAKFISLDKIRSNELAFDHKNIIEFGLKVHKGIKL